MKRRSSGYFLPRMSLHDTVIACAGFFFLSLSVEAFDESRLWLPVTYQIHYLKLKEAAASAESLERCEEVISGTLDRDQSKDNHPIFRITCRQPNSRTYNEMVDGLSFATLTTSRDAKYKLTEEELALQRLEEEKGKQARREKLALRVCEDQLQQRINLMINVRRLNTGSIEPISRTEEEMVYVIDFDAEAVGGEALRYRSTCRVRSATDYELQIGKR